VSTSRSAEYPNRPKAQTPGPGAYIRSFGYNQEKSVGVSVGKKQPASEWHGPNSASPSSSSKRIPRLLRSYSTRHRLTLRLFCVCVCVCVWCVCFSEVCVCVCVCDVCVMYTWCVCVCACVITCVCVVVSLSYTY